MCLKPKVMRSDQTGNAHVCKLSSSACELVSRSQLVTIWTCHLSGQYNEDTFVGFDKVIAALPEYNLKVSNLLQKLAIRHSDFADCLRAANCPSVDFATKL